MVAPKFRATSIPACVGGLKVLPIDAPYYICDLAAGHWKVASNGFMAFPCGSAGANRQHLLISQLGMRVFLAAIVCAMFQLILKVSASCVVAKVANIIVRWVSIIVAAVHALFTLANKCGKDKRVYVSGFAFAPLVKADGFSFDPVRSLIQNFPPPRLGLASVEGRGAAIYASHATNVRDLVKALVAKNWLPDFLHAAAPSNAPYVGTWRPVEHWFSVANLAMSHKYKGSCRG